MIKLMKLELQRINLKTYYVCSAVFGTLILAFTYFVAYVAQVEQEAQFMNYANIFRFTGAVGILLFGIMSAAMYSRIIIGEYSGKRLALLFSYPVSRGKTFLAKVLLTSIFVTGAMALCTLVPIVVFAATEHFSPIVSDTMTKHTLLTALQTAALSMAAVNTIGILAMWVGFAKKSVPATLISSFIFSGLYGNLAVGQAGMPFPSLLLIGVSLMAVVCAIAALTNQIKHMEVL